VSFIVPLQNSVQTVKSISGISFSVCSDNGPQGGILCVARYTVQEVINKEEPLKLIFEASNVRRHQDQGGLSIPRLIDEEQHVG